jgi:phosphatidate phosphatase PAH1
MPFVSRDWSHASIAKLFQEITKRKYIIIYLTARNIGLAEQTR